MKYCFKIITWATLIIFITTILGCRSKSVDKNPIRVSEVNPRYFTDNSGKAIYLTGSHTWNSLVEIQKIENEVDTFGYNAYLKMLKSYNHNFFRLWKWDLLTLGQKNNDKINIHYITLHPWLRTGKERALDGKPQFDLTQFNQPYFDRLRARVKAAQRENIYVAVMLFEGWGMQFTPDAFRNHPFHPLNNINQIDLDTAHNSDGLKIYQLHNDRVLKFQEAYVEKVIETTSDLDNVLYEISNENHPASTEWQYHMIRFIKELEKQNETPPPVGMTFQYKGGNTHQLFNSPADWISPNPDGGYRDDPPESTGHKVIISDTDHLWGIGGNRQWVWKSFLRGLNPIFMDPMENKIFTAEFSEDWEKMRIAMGHTRSFAEKIDLIKMLPSRYLASSGYCLAEKGEEYLIYIPDKKDTWVDLSLEKGNYQVEWFDPEKGVKQSGNTLIGGKKVRLTSPFETNEAVLHIKRY